jgi:hypothetical protein
VNTHDRQVEKAGAPLPHGKPLPVSPVVANAGKPGLVLRIVAGVLCSGFVLKRVEHPDVLVMLSELARQAGRMDAVLKIQAIKSAQR